MKRSVRPSVIRLPACPVSEWRRRPSAQAVVGLCGAIAALAGCTTLGTNINGSFACGAVGQGTCAPATVIDDRALAEITGDASYIPAGPFRPAPEGRPAVVAANASQQVATAGSPVPVILASGYGLEGMEDALARDPELRLFSKPFAIRNLFRTAWELLEETPVTARD